MSEPIQITPEQVAEYRRQEQATEQAAIQKCANELVELAAQHGFEIMAIPQKDERWLVTAAVVLRRKAA